MNVLGIQVDVLTFMALGSRIYRGLQPSSSSGSSVAQCRQVFAQNMSESVSTHHLLSSQWFGARPFDSHHDFQYPPAR